MSTKSIKSFIKKFLLVSIMFLVFGTKTARANLIEDVVVEPKSDGYQIVIDFFFPLSYQSHSPSEASKELRIQLIPVNFQSLTEEQEDLLRNQLQLSWDHTTGVPIGKITFEGGDPQRPQITFEFTEEVEFEVQSSVDLRSLIIRIKTDQPPTVVQEEIEKLTEEVGVIVTQDEQQAELLDDAKRAMTDKDYNRAIQLYTKILKTAGGDVKKQAQEYLGLARERNGQLAHAKAEYEKYLEQYPEGPDAQRVQQRLAGLITAAKTPKAPLVSTKAPRILGLEKNLKMWDTRFYGSLSEFYFRDQTTPQGETTQVNREDLTTDLNLNARFRSENNDMRFQYTGSYENNFMTGQENQDTLSNLAFELKNNQHGLFGKIGRQSRTSGGVLGRFDGTLLAYDINQDLTLNTVFGFPVESSRNTSIDTDKKFYGASVDLGTFGEAWDFVAFFINQENHGITDRRAIGGEVRYFEPNKSFFSLIDYDVFYKALNIFLINGRYSFPTKTVLNLIFDYRKSPILTTNNAIQGQGVNNLSELFNSFTEDELNQLAEDRSALSKSLTFSITQDLKEDIQLTGEVTASELEGTPASGGVDSVEGTGIDMSYSTQLILTNLFYENDAIITGIRYSDTNQSNTVTLTANGRFPYKKRLRFIPKFRFDYSEEKDTSDNRVLIRPVMRIDYQLKKWIQFETEGGFEFRDEKSTGLSSKSTESFILVGFRINF